MINNFFVINCIGECFLKIFQKYIWETNNLQKQLWLIKKKKKESRIIDRDY